VSKPTVLDSAARAEIKEAELYYDERRPGLGERFHEAVYAALASLERQEMGHASNALNAKIAEIEEQIQIRQAELDDLELCP